MDQHNDTKQHGQNKQDTHIRLKQDIACALNYSFEPKQCGPNIDTPVIDDFSIHPTKTDSQLNAKDKNLQWELIDKKIKLQRVFDQLHAEDKIYMDNLRQGLNGTNSDIYIRTRRKRFILQAVSLFNEVLGTFMGAFNAYEIRQLKKQFNSLSEGHNMLVCVTQQHDNDIKNLVRNIDDE
jgi:hypothetical protein